MCSASTTKSAQKRKTEFESDKENEIPTKTQKNQPIINPTYRSDTNANSPGGAKDLASLAIQQ